MKAHIKPRKGARFRVVKARMRPFSSQLLSKPLTAEVWGRDLTNNIHEQTRLKLNDFPNSHLGLKGVFSKEKSGIRFIDALPITSFSGRGTIIGCLWYGIKYLPQKFVLDLNQIQLTPGMSSYSGTISVGGFLEVDYIPDKIRCC